MSHQIVWQLFVRDFTSFFTREDMDQGHQWSRHLIMISKENDHDEF